MGPGTVKNRFRGQISVTQGQNALNTCSAAPGIPGTDVNHPLHAKYLNIFQSGQASIHFHSGSHTWQRASESSRSTMQLHNKSVSWKGRHILMFLESAGIEYIHQGILIIYSEHESRSISTWLSIVSLSSVCKIRSFLASLFCKIRSRP